MTKGTKAIVVMACSIAVLSSAGSVVYVQKVQQETQQAIAIIRQEKETVEQLRAEAERTRQEAEDARLAAVESKKHTEVMTLELIKTYQEEIDTLKAQVEASKRGANTPSS